MPTYVYENQLWLGFDLSLLKCNPCSFIDDNKAIRQTYAGFITSGDVLSEMMKLLKEQKPDFGEVMGAFLQKEIVYEKAAKLESAGQYFDRQTLLARVFANSAS
ncbi:MAG: hypothetical protein ABFS56_21540 [Pseudomonadota bacterium]